MSRFRFIVQGIGNLLIKDLPSRLDAATGSTATLKVEAFIEADVPLQYTWQQVIPGGEPVTLAGSTGPTLTLTNVQPSYGGNQYQCIVRNVATGKIILESNICKLNVFYASDYLTITQQPPEKPIIRSTPLAPNQDQITATVNVTGTQDLSKYKYAWMYARTVDGGKDWSYKPVDDTSQESGSTRAVTDKASGSLSDLPATLVSGSTYSISVPLSLEYTDNDGNLVPREAGYYRLYITNEASVPVTASGVDPDNTEHAITKTNPAYVFVGEPGTVAIVTQPQNQTVTQGTSATFSVVGATPDNGTLTYQWQKWIYPDTANAIPTGADTTPLPATGISAGYWWDCTSEDGTGLNTNTFTTVPTTAQMRIAASEGKPFFYRCIVYSYTTGNSTKSDAARLKITAEIPVQPGLVPIPGSGLTIVNNYLRGLNATKDGTTAGTLIGQMTEYRNCTIVVRDRSGAALPNNTVVGTACTIEIQNAAGEVIGQPAIIIVSGDVLGSGKMTLSQLVQMAGYYKGTTMLSGPYLMAGDLNGSGTINLSDLVQEAKTYKQYFGADQPAATATPSPTPTPSPIPTPNASASPTPSPSPSRTASA